jgi:hypothetical protein
MVYPPQALVYRSQRESGERKSVVLVTAEESGKNVYSVALRFATRKPAAARKYDFWTIYGTSKLVP